jgi:hypothetical protein
MDISRAARRINNYFWYNRRKSEEKTYTRIRRILKEEKDKSNKKLTELKNRPKIKLSR